MSGYFFYMLKKEINLTHDITWINNVIYTIKHGEKTNLPSKKVSKDTSCAIRLVNYDWQNFNKLVLSLLIILILLEDNILILINPFFQFHNILMPT